MQIEILQGTWFECHLLSTNWQLSLAKLSGRDGPGQAREVVEQVLFGAGQEGRRGAEQARRARPLATAPLFARTARWESICSLSCSCPIPRRVSTDLAVRSITRTRRRGAQLDVATARAARPNIAVTALLLHVAHPWGGAMGHQPSGHQAEGGDSMGIIGFSDENKTVLIVIEG